MGSSPTGSKQRIPPMRSSAAPVGGREQYGAARAVHCVSLCFYRLRRVTVFHCVSVVCVGLGREREGLNGLEKATKKGSRGGAFERHPVPGAIPSEHAAAVRSFGRRDVPAIHVSRTSTMIRMLRICAEAHMPRYFLR